MYLANGKVKNPIKNMIKNKIFTCFIPKLSTLDARKKMDHKLFKFIRKNLY